MHQSTPVGAVSNRARVRGRAYNARLPMFRPKQMHQFPPVGAVCNRARVRGRAYNARLPKSPMRQPYIESCPYKFSRLG